MTAPAGLERVVPTMGANFGDLDNDGYLDLYLGTGGPSYGLLIPNRLFLNRPAAGGERHFVDVTTATGTGHLQKGHGVSFADFDHDGDQDIFSNMGGAFPGDKYPSALFENPGHGNDWIVVELVGSRSHRSALGARVRVLLENEDGPGERYRWVGPGGSFGSSPLRQQIGLGKDARIVRLEVDWPSWASASEQGQMANRVPQRQVFEEVPVNRLVRIVEGEPGFKEIVLETFDFPSGDSHGHAH